MRFQAIFTGIIGALALMACSNMETLQPSQSFSNELGKQYTKLSVNNEVSGYKWLKTDYFAKKGQRAALGIDVQPEDPATWNVPGEYRPELNNAYDMLQIALVPDKKKVLKPVPAADAQAYFDCWIEQAHKHWVPNAHENDCRAAFYEAFCSMYNGKCSSAIDSDHIFRIYFGRGQSSVTSKGDEIIKKVVTTYKKSGKEIIVAGHTDRIGDAKHNMKISLDRALEVKKKLLAAGVSEKRITVKAFGDKMLLVPTAKNTPNASNRRVLIVVR